MGDRGEISVFSSSTEESSAAASSSAFSSRQLREEEEEEHDLIQQNIRHTEVEQQHTGITYRGNITTFDDANSGSAIRDDTWSCIIVVLTFWFFVSMTLILGVYGSVNFRLGPNSSILIQPNSIFVQTFKVEELDDTTTGPLLYGFYKPPALDVVTNWSTTQNVTISADSHQEWIYYLNEGSQMSISYSVNTAGSPLFLVIAQGNEGLAQWLEDPSYPNSTLSWNLINGVGKIQQDIYRSANYYVAVGNLNAEDVEVQLDLTVTAYLYNTSGAYFKCSFSHGVCTLDILFPTGNTAVLATPSPGEGTSGDEWYVRLSYRPRWITYIFGIGGMTMLMLLAFNFMNKIRWTREGPQYDPVDPRAPLLTPKDDDVMSLGSSYDSASQDEEDPEEFLAGQGKLKDIENGNITRRLCSICFDAPRDCFFLPCGHCVTCFECGSRILESAGTCPLCGRNMKKLRKIFTV